VHACRWLSLLFLALSTPAQDLRARSEVVVHQKDGSVLHKLARGVTSVAPAGIRDPDLEPGFPVSALADGGSYWPPAIVAVGNLDRDRELEILFTGLTRGPLYVWNHDGTLVSGWPLPASGAAYPVMGRLAPAGVPDDGTLLVFAGFNPSLIGVWSRMGLPAFGWPQPPQGFITVPAALADIDYDGRDEIFSPEEDRAIHAYRASGKRLAGWPARDLRGDQHRTTPAIADLDGDGDLELVTGTGSGGTGYLLAYHHDGSPVTTGFPITLTSPGRHTTPVLGHVTNSASLDIVVVSGQGAPIPSVVRVFSASGAERWSRQLTGDTQGGTIAALADLDDDGLPEIVVQTTDSINVLRGDGSPFEGWPRFLGGPSGLTYDSHPVVGDVTGDGLPDILVLGPHSGTWNHRQILLYDRHGQLHPRFPKVLPVGSGAVPAIADIDADGRNEIIIGGHYWDGVPGMYDAVWAFDLGGGTHGPVLWGQYMGGPRHQGLYGQAVN
jgi:hypothetical protein